MTSLPILDSKIQGARTSPQSLRCASTRMLPEYQGTTVTYKIKVMRIDRPAAMQDNEARPHTDAIAQAEVPCACISDEARRC